MLKSILLAGVLAVFAAPAVSVAQPYDDNGYNDHSYNSDRDNGDYDGRDNGGRYQDDHDNDSGNASDYRPVGRRVFTGRVGASWWEEGRRCQWREVTWRDRDGDSAYKWVTVCDDQGN